MRHSNEPCPITSSRQDHVLPQNIRQPLVSGYPDPQRYMGPQAVYALLYDSGVYVLPDPRCYGLVKRDQQIRSWKRRYP